MGVFMSNTDNKMDMWNGMQWMVWFGRNGKDSSFRADPVIITAPRWHVQDAKQWIQDRTGCYISSISLVRNTGDDDDS